MEIRTFAATSPAVNFRRGIPAADLLRFGWGNGKLHSGIAHFSLPAGWACPGARACLAKATEKAPGKWGVEDGPEVEFRCFSASEEARYPQVREIRWQNFGTLKRYADRERTHADKANAMAALILASLPTLSSPFDGFSVAGTAYKLVCRLHVGGDFFSQDYFDAWLAVCGVRPDLLAYGYTKSLNFWVRRLDALPRNLVLTASEGGRHDALIAEHGLRSARVVFSEAEAAALGLELDNDDSHAMRHGRSFGLLVHGPQPAGSPASKAVAAQRAAGDFGYGKKARRIRSARVALPVVAAL